MRRVSLAIYGALLVVAAGCGGSSDDFKQSPYEGSWRGSWVNIRDFSDKGSAVWTIDRKGNVTGTDSETGSSTTYALTGKVDEKGTLSATTTSDGESVSLTGTLSFASSDQVGGDLTWQVSPTLTYRYVLTRD